MKQLLFFGWNGQRMFVMDCYVGCLSVADMSAALMANRAGIIRSVQSPLVPLPQPGAAIWFFCRGEIVATVAAVLSTRFSTFDEWSGISLSNHGKFWSRMAKRSGLNAASFAAKMRLRARPCKAQACSTF